MEDASEDDICIDSQAYYIPSTRNVRVSENILYAKREEDSTVAVGPPIRRGIWHIRLTFANSGFTRGILNIQYDLIICSFIYFIIYPFSFIH